MNLCVLGDLCGKEVSLRSIVEKGNTLFGLNIFWILNSIFCILISKSPVSDL